MKYLLFAVLFIRFFAIHCKNEIEVLNTKNTTLKTADLKEIESIIASINTNSRSTNLDKWELTVPFNSIRTFTGQKVNFLNNIDPCSPRAGVCGDCPGFCQNTEYKGKHVILGSLNNDTFRSDSYRTGHRLVAIGIVTHQQTGKEKIIMDFTHSSSFLMNNKLYLTNDSQLFPQLIKALNKHNITLKAGIYPTTYHTSTGNPQTIIDAIIQ